MVRTRVIPALLLHDESLVKTRQFGDYTYVGDPCNTVRIFNELEVDELLFLDINATIRNTGPNFKVLKEISDECFMPLAYGGGITHFDEVREIFKLGFEKVAINASLNSAPDLIHRLANSFGSQAIIGSIDVKHDYLGRKRVYTHKGRKNIRKGPVEWAKYIEELGVGEILLTSIKREGTWSGFDLDLIEEVSSAVSVPVIAHGGAGDISDIFAAKRCGASAIALGSMVVFQRKNMGVLITFPNKEELECL